MAAAQTQRATCVLVICASAALTGYLGFASLHGAALKWTALAPLPVLFLSAYNYLRQRRLAFQKSRLTRFYQRGVQRLTDSWMGNGQSGEEFETGPHPYSRDLNLFGSGSVFELLCTARTQVGRARLASWLMNVPDDGAETLARQQAVQELAPRRSLRDEVHLLGDFDFEGCEWGAFDEWLSNEPVKAPTIVRIAMAVISAALAGSALALFLKLIFVFVSPADPHGPGRR